MKKFLLLTMLLSFFIKTFSQDYYQKSRNQKTTAWVLLGTGTTLILVGAIAGMNSVSNDIASGIMGESSSSSAGSEAAIALVGIAADLASIPFFISASKNKRLAGEVRINNQKLYSLQKIFVAIRYAPGITIKINLDHKN